MIDEKRLLKRFLDLLKIMAPSGRERAVTERVVPELKRLGLEVTIDDSHHKTGSDSGNVIARLSPSENSKDWAAFVAHMDSVYLSEPVMPAVKEGVVYSLGDTILGADDRAGIAIILEALEVIVERGLPHRGIEVIFTVSEEIGLLGARELDRTQLISSMAFVLDSSASPGSIITRAPYASGLDWSVKGIAAHAGGSPERGINAIQAASRGIANMNIGRIDGETTANIGIIEGGHATNIVCDRVDIKAEARSLDEDKLRNQLNHMRDIMKKSVTSYGATLLEKVIDRYPGFCLSKDENVVKEAKKALNMAGLSHKIISSGGGSDANILNYKGLPSVNLGLGYQGAHTKEEYIELLKLYEMTRTVLKLMTNRP